MSNFAELIQEHMAVVCTDGTQLGTVDHLDGENSIKLTRDENDQHHWIPLGWVTGVEDDTVTIDRSVIQAQEEWSDSAPQDL